MSADDRWSYGWYKPALQRGLKRPLPHGPSAHEHHGALQALHGLHQSPHQRGFPRTSIALQDEGRLRHGGGEKAREVFHGQSLAWGEIHGKIVGDKFGQSVFNHQSNALGERVLIGVRPYLKPIFPTNVTYL